MKTRPRLRIVNKGRSTKQRAVTRRFAEKSYAIGQIPRDGGTPPDSWWIGTSREAFVQRLAGEAARMQTSRFGRVVDPTLSGE